MKNIDSFDGKYRFLSNFYPANVEYDGLGFNSSEAAYQAQKSPDWNVRVSFMGSSAGFSKQRGQKIKIRKDWDAIKKIIMYNVVTAKFKQNRMLRWKLRATGNAQLTEGNHWHDNYWGICNCTKCPGEGFNELGKILMRIRREIG